VSGTDDHSGAIGGLSQTLILVLQYARTNVRREDFSFTIPEPGLTEDMQNFASPEAKFCIGFPALNALPA
jgi:hypothetical protein